MAPGFLVWVAELVHSHRARLLTYLRRRGLAPDDALDVVQDSFATFLTLPEAQSVARVGDDAIKLLTVIARHNMMNRRRKGAIRETGLDMGNLRFFADTESSEELLLRAEDVARVNGCIRGMTRVQRAVILLSALDERPREDVGAILGISAGHVRVLLHRAREHVRRCPFEEMPPVSARELRDSLADS
jgi:RNA polymerase sigma factor (sigma-70 family)